MGEEDDASGSLGHSQDPSYLVGVGRNKNFIVIAYHDPRSLAPQRYSRANRIEAKMMPVRIDRITPPHAEKSAARDGVCSER
jgi:hypothetical protein